MSRDDEDPAHPSGHPEPSATGGHHDHAHGQDHGHGHQSGHGHAHAVPDGFGVAFALGTALNAAFVGAEITFGVAAHSVALLADAAHNVGDVLGLALAWGAAWLGRRRPTLRRTYGYGRSSILASLANAGILLVGVGAIIVEAIRRFFEAAPVAGSTVLFVALVGILVNGGTALLFARGRHGELNVRGAYLHMLSDAGVSAGVALSGLVLALTGWTWIDPLTSLTVAGLIVFASWGLLRDSLNLAMDAVPPGIEEGSVRRYLRALPGVTDIHDLHIWGLSTSRTALTAHLVRESGPASATLLHDAADTLRQRFGIDHVTLQLEDIRCDPPCALLHETAPAG